MKWSWNTKMLTTLYGLSSSMVISILVKSTCKRSMGTVAMIGCRGTLGKLPSCHKQCVQDLRDCCICLTIPGHQKHSLNKARVWSWSWWPTSLWHLFRVTTQWALVQSVTCLCVEAHVPFVPRCSHLQWWQGHGLQLNVLLQLSPCQGLISPCLNSKLNHAWAPTHQWLVASRLVVSLCKSRDCYLSLPGKIDRADIL